MSDPNFVAPSDRNFLSVRWCNLCSAEQAISKLEVEMFGKWQEIDVGRECLTRLETSATIEQQ